jgi:hypothetical protein
MKGRPMRRGYNTVRVLAVISNLLFGFWICSPMEGSGAPLLDKVTPALSPFQRPAKMRRHLTDEAGTRAAVEVFTGYKASRRNTRRSTTVVQSCHAFVG